MQSVSIVIPCRNEEKYIARCIDSILNQDYPLNKIEVFVCDGNSDDKTVSIVRQYVSSNTTIHLLKNEKQTTPFALNMGIKASQSDIVIILGAHSEIYSDYVSNCVAAFNFETNIGCTGGVIENIYDNKTSQVIGKAMSSSFGVGNAHFRTGKKEGIVDTVAFGAYKREVFEKIGLFDEELIRNQDDEFNFRLTKAGFKIYLFSKIRSKYYVRASYKKLFMQYFQYGYWKVYVNKKHKTITTLRQVIPLLFVLYLFLGILPLLFLHNYIYIYSTGMGIYIFAAFFFAIKLGSSFGEVIKIVFSFFILHFSYGWGYLKGIIDFFMFQRKIKKEELLTR